MKKIMFGLVIFAGFLRATAQDDPQKALKFSGEVVKTFTIDYLLYQPKGNNVDGNTQWPLLVFLHGSGERGGDLEKVKVHGPPMLISMGEKFPFFVLSPQCPEGIDWDTESLHALIRQVVSTYNIDERRVYVTGLSMGGRGTWDLAFAHPDYYAAIAPVCGPVDRNYGERASELKEMAIWVFHGAMDNVVPIAPAAMLVNELHKAGSQAKFTIYPDANHNSWTETYNNPQLYEWLLKQKRR
ncbi:MAG: prolyl oligopeptidase family serine peptidase [Lentimicrobium sp.]|jgi:predicted peptidase|nr:prolyl oligopeptidase family serine peptidase [Lentimicrobium sp.]